uniref:TIL domain-containing protein n=1 Tax=Drosophila melanogaster TaxID=7227 RepID=A0A6H2EG72_DROME|nr:uncharacterized protein Dmel_CG46042 [Drosophila melanogaster]QJC18474.1 uncharacterized protein Dmel_CG46042 [Drosophila melanogaster]
MLNRQTTLKLFTLFILMGSSLASTLSEPCGENEERACLPCTEPKCSHPYIEEPYCVFIKKCRLGCACKFGYIRHDLDNRCISVLDCKIPVRQLKAPIW